MKDYLKQLVETNEKIRKLISRTLEKEFTQQEINEINYLINELIENEIKQMNFVVN